MEGRNRVQRHLVILFARFCSNILKVLLPVKFAIQELADLVDDRGRFLTHALHVRHDLVGIVVVVDGDLQVRSRRPHLPQNLLVQLLFNVLDEFLLGFYLARQVLYLVVEHYLDVPDIL